MLTAPAYLITGPGLAGPAPGPARTGERSVPAAHRVTWFLGTELRVSRLAVPDPDARQDAAAGARIGLVTPAGKDRWLPTTAASPSQLSARPRHPLPAVAVISQAGRLRSQLGPPSLTAAGGSVFDLNGQLQDALTPPQWQYTGQDGPFGIFTDQRARSSLAIAALPGRTAAGASVRRLAGTATDPTAAAVRSPHGALVIRPVAATPGWSATWQPRRGPAIPLAVGRDGVVQAVGVPPGQGVLTWAYTPPGFRVGGALSVAALLLIVLRLVAGPAPLAGAGGPGWRAPGRARRALRRPPDSELLPGSELLPDGELLPGSRAEPAAPVPGGDGAGITPPPEPQLL